MASLADVEQLPLLLEASLPGWLRRARKKRGFHVAIDVHHQPYYGKMRVGVFRAQSKQGTKLFWSTATAAIVYRGEKLTLAAVPVTSNRMEVILNALWPQIRKLRVKVRRLLLDRAFYSAAVVAWLQAHHVSFIMPMVRRGRVPRKNRGGTGTAPFFRRGRKGFTTYTWEQRKHGPA